MLRNTVKFSAPKACFGLSAVALAKEEGRGGFLSIRRDFHRPVNRSRWSLFHSVKLSALRSALEQTSEKGRGIETVFPLGTPSVVPLTKRVVKLILFGIMLPKSPFAQISVHSRSKLPFCACREASCALLLRFSGSSRMCVFSLASNH